MPRHPDFVLFSLAAIHLILFAICPVSSRIYETKDAVVIEVDLDAEVHPSTRSARNGNYGNLAALIPTMPYAFNPYYNALYRLQQPNFLSWLYPLYKPVSSSVSDVAATSAESRQQNIPCGVGPDSPPGRNTPTVGVVGGTDAKPNSWPFVVGLRRFGFNSGAAFCGGSLISTTRILTAAHCVNKLTEFDISIMTVSLGMHVQGNPPNIENDAQQTRRVKRVVYHRDYDSKTFQNDIAMLTIEPPIIYSKDISPICLAPASTAADQFIGKDTVIMGWGKLQFGGFLSLTLQQAAIQVISQAKCNEFWVSFTPISNQHVCAGASGKDTCQGDSGGPMVVQMTDGSTSWTQVGVTSFGNDCPADLKRPSVYANVAFFRSWIDTYMDDNYIS